MKYMLLILLTLFSLNSFANDYVKKTIGCKVTGDQADLIDTRKEKFSNEQNFAMEVTSISKTIKIRRAAFKNESYFNLPNIRKLRTKKTKYRINFDNLSKEESKEILEILGAHNVPNLPYGFRLKPTINKSNCGPYGNRLCSHFEEIRAQIHFNKKHNDGLSYHLIINCKLNQFNN
jgi:hypothetical protein